MNDIISKFEPTAELQKLEIKENEILVVKINANTYDLNKAQEIFSEITNTLPESVRTNVVGIPVGVELETSTIDEMIKILENMKK
jgi:hypothetical protein